MARMSVRSTYALDEATAAAIKRLAAAWEVSQAEVIRRSVAQALEAQPSRGMTPSDVIAYYATRPPVRSAAEMARRVKALRETRREEDAALDRRRRSPRGSSAA